MKRKELESRLGELKSFERPKVKLEQYQTSAEIASTVLHTIVNSYEDFRGKIVADFGCGCGTLAIGASLLGAGFCVGFDVDPDAMSVCADNIDIAEVENVDLVLCDVTKFTETENLFRTPFDIAIMNPPFGTKRNEGVDVQFLRAALALGCRTVYSMHKSSTRSYLMKKAREWKTKPTVIAELRFDLPATMRFHSQRSVDIEVDLLRLEKI